MKKGGDLGNGSPAGLVLRAAKVESSTIRTNRGTLKPPALNWGLISLHALVSGREGACT